MCSLAAGGRGRRVLLVERARRAGSKILISGGGRCNFTNLRVGAEHFFSANPHFAKSALARYTPRDFIALVERYGIRYHEKTLGQLFCDGSAREIVAMLERECRAARVTTLLGCEVSSVERTDRFRLATSQGEFSAPALVVATGGLSIPKLGATDFGYRLARQFGLAIVPCFPALTPLRFGAEDLKRYSGLAGVSAEVVAACHGARFRDRLLFTHQGMSGPAILQISSYWRPGEAVSIDWLDSTALPRRLLKRLREVHGAVEADWLHHWQVTPAASEGYAKAEVTGGGVDTRELSSQSMEARRAPGLYFIGEVVDVTGHLGGYNFQWAWASGHAAGLAV
jgi:predicted Rossmann fold flavoprotein